MSFFFFPPSPFSLNVCLKYIPRVQCPARRFVSNNISGYVASIFSISLYLSCYHCTCVSFLLFLPSSLSFSFSSIYSSPPDCSSLFSLSFSLRFPRLSSLKFALAYILLYHLLLVSLSRFLSSFFLVHPPHPFLVPPVRTRAIITARSHCKTTSVAPRRRWRRRRHHRLRRRRFHHRYYHSHTKTRLSTACALQSLGPVLKPFSLPQPDQQIFLFDLLSFIFDDSAAARCTRWLPTMMSSFRRDIPTYISRRCSPFRGTGLDAPVSSCVIVRLIQVISIDADVHGLFHLSILNWRKETFSRTFLYLILAFLRMDPWKWIDDESS